ncbi:MAG: diaminopimelate decarboxylase [Thermoanaerobaculia bacterium]
MRYQNGTLHIGGVAATELIETFGSPLYVYDADVIERQAKRILSAFSSLPFQPFYAMKANSNLAILRLLHGFGFGCDAVSPGEVFLAKHAGFDSTRIWFTGSNVSQEDLRELDDPEIVVNINSLAELDKFLALGLPNPIALRINPDVGAGHHRDVVTGGLGVKFGIDLAELDSARMIATDEGRTIVGIHAHIGSGVTEVDPLLRSARTLTDHLDAFDELKWVNFGGGISIPYKPGESEFPIEEYGQRLGELAGEILRKRGLKAILEPGRYVAAQSGTLLARVTAKRLSAGVEWVGVDTGFNHLVRPSKYGSYHHVLNASRGDDALLRENVRPGSPHDADGVIIGGNLCESGDVFTRSENGLEPRWVPGLHEGDVVAFCDAGAYGFSMASHYNARLLPPELMVRGTEVTLVRERQPMEDLLRGQV